MKLVISGDPFNPCMISLVDEEGIVSSEVYDLALERADAYAAIEDYIDKYGLMEVVLNGPKAYLAPVKEFVEFLMKDFEE